MPDNPWAALEIPGERGLENGSTLASPRSESPQCWCDRNKAELSMFG